MEQQNITIKEASEKININYSTAKVLWRAYKAKNKEGKKEQDKKSEIEQKSDQCRRACHIREKKS